jgi:hypothetical protein
MIAIARLAPRDASAPRSAHRAGPPGPGYAEVFRHATFVRFAPMGFFQYGGMIAVQSLWAGPWLVNLCGWSPDESARGLFGINVSMLLSFMTWGAIVPRLHARGWTAQRLIARGMPLSLAALVLALLLGTAATAWVWALFCVTSTFVALSQPVIGQSFPSTLAGRALTAYNLIVFVGVFVVQWGIGLAIDAMVRQGWSTLSAYRGAFALFAGCCALSYLWFLCWDDGPAPTNAETRT